MNFRKTTPLAVLAATAVLGTAPAAMAQDAMVNDTVTSAQVAKGYKVPNRAAIGRPWGKMDVRLEPFEKQLNSLGFTLLRPSDPWLALPIITERQLIVQNKLNLAAGSTKTTGTAATTVSDTYTKSMEGGDKSAVWSRVGFTMVHSGNPQLARLRTEAKVEGAMFGITRTVGLAYGDVQGPYSGDKTIQFGLEVMGQTIWTKNASGATATIEEGAEKSAKLWQTGFDFSIAGYGVGAKVWLQGVVGCTTKSTAKSLAADMGAGAYADIYFGGLATANLPGVGARLDAKLSVVNLKLSTMAATTVSQPGRFGDIANTPRTMTAKRRTELDLGFLKGFVKVNAYVDLPLIGEKSLGTWVIWDEPTGIFRYLGVLNDYSKSYTVGGTGGIRG
ncbi:MAG: hypothetical protein ACKO5K_06850 [Armatimonadota bacterium]